MHELINEIKKKMDASHEIFLNGIKGIRTGRASPQLLDGVVVSIDGGKLKLNYISTINVVNSRTLSISIWDTNNVGSVKNALISSGLNLNPIVEGNVIRIVIPDLSEESRKSYVKSLKKQAEEAKIVIRNISRDIIAKFKDIEKDKKISEDESKRYVEEVRNITTKQIEEIELASKTKESDIMNS